MGAAFFMEKGPRLSIVIPVMGHIEETKGVWGALIGSTMCKGDHELVVINNNSQDGTVEFIEKFVFPHFPKHKLVNNPDNVGVVQSMQQAYTESTGDIICIFHNDLYILDNGWDARIIGEFERDEKLGLAGFIGAEGIAETGGRINTVSNMLEAEVHGLRVKGSHPVVVFDGMSLICRRAMLDEVGGFDTEYTYHHFYDRDISMESYTNGWHNKMIGVLCHHRSGITANRPEYQYWIEGKMGTKGLSEGGKTGDQLSYELSEKRFFEKWGKFLPIWVK